jgi:hypothetical protein
MPFPGVPPDGSASNLAPAVQRVKSSATAPPPYRFQLAFDAANIEFTNFPFVMPTDYAGGTLTCKFQFKMFSATTGNIIAIARLAAITPGDTTDADAKAYDAENASSAIAVPATTAGKIAEGSFTITNKDSVAAGDDCVLMFGRKGSDASDTASGDMEVTSVRLEY